MNFLNSKRRSSTARGEQSSCPPEDLSSLMIDDAPPADTQEQVPLVGRGDDDDDDDDGRHVLGLIQCPHCSEPFSTPVTLPCGHTVCRSCLPPAQARANISYPDTPDRQLGIACPLAACRAEHAAGECSVDVTLAKVVHLVRTGMDSGGQEGKGAGGSDSGSEKTADKQDLDAPGLIVGRLREGVRRELDCLVCYHLMLDPTTTGCGHTFCRRCLSRVMDHSNLCPICRRQLHVPASLEHQPSNARLVALLDRLCPDLVAARVAALAAEEQPAGDELDTPLFVCTLSLPAMPTFLHIFEPRYRLMMRRCMQGNRRFGMVLYNRAASPQGDLGVSGFMEYGTLLEIVHLDLLRDGRSFVETRGISRFRVRAHGMLDGYDVGRVEKVEDVALTEEERQEADETTTCAALAAQARLRGQSLTPDLDVALLPTRELLERARAFIERMRLGNAPWLNERIVEIYGGPPHDPAVFPYWFACVIPIAEEEKYLLLKTNTVRERLKIVNGWIQRIERQRWASGSSCTVL